VCLADLAKGAAMVGLARWLGASEIWTQLVVLAVIVGHIWPMQLGFRGGRGVGPLIGAWLVLDPIVLLPTLVVTLVALALLRRFTRAGLCGLAVLPVAVWWFKHDWAIVMLAAATLLVVFYGPPRTSAALVSSRCARVVASFPQSFQPTMTTRPPTSSSGLRVKTGNWADPPAQLPHLRRGDPATCAECGRPAVDRFHEETSM